MNSFIHQILNSNKIQPPANVEESFNHFFDQPYNVDWYLEGNMYEAVFYQKNLEYIARFDAQGTLMDTKSNLPLDHATQQVSDRAHEVGELMNLIEIRQGDNVFFEIIARDSKLDRYTLLLTSSGELIEKRKL